MIGLLRGTARSNPKSLKVQIWRVIRRCTKGRMSIGIAGGFLLGTLAIVLVVPTLPSFDAYSQDLGGRLLPPGTRSASGLHILGTDALGRDVLSRLAIAGRLSLMIGLAATALSLLVGTVLGLVAGFLGGRTENIVMGLADVQLSVPRMVLMIAIVAAVGPSVGALILVLGLTSWVAYGRVARAMTLSLREREFVLASRALGAPATWIMRRHVIANLVGQMLIIASFELGHLISVEASLSFLGLGIQAPTPSWGGMISDGQSYLQTAWWLALAPGLAMFALIAGIQFLTQLATAEGTSPVRNSDTASTGAEI